MDTFTTVHPVRKQISAFAIGTFVGLVLSASAFLISSASAGPSRLDMARSTLSTSYDRTQEIKTHCEAIIEIVEGTQKELHDTAAQLGK